VIGPITRAGVSALAGAGGDVKVPTLSLNLPDRETRLPPALYTFGLPVEHESREVARAAYGEKPGAVAVLTLNTPFAKRAAAAFAAEWAKQGGKVTETIELPTPAAYIKLRRQLGATPLDWVFLSADAASAKQIRPYIGSRAIISTSQVYGGRVEQKADVVGYNDLDGIRFVDMPWLHQPDHAAAIVYAKPQQALTGELERLYALGIDAYRLAIELAKDPAQRIRELDGVTGKLVVRDNNVERTLIQAAYKGGVVVLTTSQ
jgi:uncharacterized protein